MKANEFLLFWAVSSILNIISYLWVNRNIEWRYEWSNVFIITIVGPFGLFPAFLCVVFYYQNKQLDRFFERKNK